MGIAETVSGRLNLQRVLTAVFVFGGTVYAFGMDRSVAIGVGLAIASIELVRTLREAPDVDTRYVKLAVGLFVAGGSVLLYVISPANTTTITLSGVAGATGIWISLDAVADFRRGTVPKSSDDVSTLRAGFESYVAKLVVNELREGPRTLEELATACDLTESRVHNGVRLLEDSGVVDRRGDAYVLDETNLGGVAFLRMNISRVVRRLSRPIRG